MIEWNGIDGIEAHLSEGALGTLRSFVIINTDGSRENRDGTLRDASAMASEHGLVMVPTVGGWFQWVRDHESWWDPR